MTRRELFDGFGRASGFAPAAVALGISICTTAAAPSAAAHARPAVQAVPATPDEQGQRDDRANGDARWDEWLGCWRVVTEGAKERRMLDPSDPHSASPQGRRLADDVRVCVEPAAANGVRLVTWVREERTHEQVVVADGSRRPVAREGCEGWERSAWSSSGQRLLSRAELTCGDMPSRTVSGMSLLASDGGWIDIQGVTVDGRDRVRVRRYARDVAPREGASDRPQRRSAAPDAVGAPLTIEEVKELSAAVPPSVLEAALVETDARFPLRGGRLMELDAAGVADSVIDLMVALSFPRHFVVERTSVAEPWPFAGGVGATPWLGPSASFYWPLFVPYDEWTLYTPLGFTAWRWYDRLHDPVLWGYPVHAGGQPPGEPVATVHGRVIAGQGYTRVMPRQAEASGSSSSGGGSSSSASGDSGASGVSSQGYSSGAGGDGGRTAQPRNP